MYGLDAEVINKIKAVFENFPEITQAVLYGSRAKGNHRKGSDIDLTLYGKNLSVKTIYNVTEELDNLYLPYSFDISIYKQIDNPDLIDHIKRVGKVFYERSGSKQNTDKDAINRVSTDVKKLPEGWEWKKLGDAFIVERGGSPRPIKKYITDSSDGVNWIKIGDATASGKYIYSTKQKITKDGLKKTRFVNEGDFLLSNSMSFGHPYIMKTNGCIHDGWLVLKKREDYVIDQEYLYYILSSPNIYFQFDTLAAGSTVRNLNINLVSSIEIPLPPLAEQKRIVAILDEAFKAIDKAKANAEKNLANAKELFESYLNGIFANPGEGWEEKKLGEVCEVINGGTPKSSVKEYWDGDVNWVTPKDLGQLNYRYIENTPRKITKIGLQKSSAKLFPSRSVILSTRAPIGHLAINLGKMSTNQGCRGIVPGTNVFTEFIYYFLFNSVELLNNLGNGATFKELSSTSLKNIIIPLPPLSEQKRIVNHLDKLSAESEQLKSIYQQKITALDELKKSILKKAFEGDL